MTKKFLSIFLGVCLCVLSVGTAFSAMSDSKFLELCKNGTYQQIKNALNTGANINAKDKDGWSPLHLVANRNPDPQVVILLINYGANVNARNKNQGTPLMWAAANNTNPRILEILIECGADINANSIVGLTALMLAAQHNPNPKIIETLIDYKADVQAKDKNGDKALDHAKRNNSIKNSTAYKRLGGGTTGISSYKRRYMVCVRDDVDVRTAPNAKSKSDSTIWKDSYVLVVAEHKNAEEKHYWYKIIDERWQKEQVLGWVYGQYLRNTIEKKNVNMGLQTLNGIPWGTPHSQIRGLPPLKPAPKDDKRGWKFYSTQKRGGYQEDNIYLPVAEITYLFDKNKCLIGADIAVDMDDDDDDNLSAVMSYLNEKLGETQDVDRYSGCQVYNYEFSDFKVAFGMAGETTFYYYVQKK